MTKLKYRKILFVILVSSVIFLGVYYLEYIKNKIPNKLYVRPYNEDVIDLDVPLLGSIEVYKDNNEYVEASVNLMNDFSMKSACECTYTADVKLLGIIPVKKIQIFVTEPEKLIACGIPIGIHLETDGVLVVDTGNISSNSGELESPAKGIIKAGDYIIDVNGKNVSNKNELIDAIQNASEIIELKVRRNGEVVNIKIKSILDDTNSRKIGVWIKDDCQGLGTLTYVDSDGNFGSLGHGICHENAGELINIKNGYIYTSKIWSIIKGKKGNPGEVVGSINYGEDNCLGTVEKNSTHGIYGKTNANTLKHVEDIYLDVAYKQDIKKGKAYIRTFVGGEVSDYEINIYKISYAKKDDNKGIVFEVTDKNLLEKTNGIVQGMSGSPIIQDGKIIGAVTHVFVNEPHKGYGIFIENMLN